jgi:hypothetical protein
MSNLHADANLELKKPRTCKPKAAQVEEVKKEELDEAITAPNKPRTRKPKAAQVEDVKKEEVNEAVVAPKKPRTRKPKAANVEPPASTDVVAEEPISKPPKKVKDPNAPKRTRAPTPYNLFLKEVMSRLAADNPSERPQARMIRAVEQWRAHKATNTVTA